MKAPKSLVSSFAEVERTTNNARRNGKTVVTTNGCFDILHIGHIRYLAHAKSLGDILIVGVNSDASVRALKGAGRPVVPARERAELVAALKMVDAVFMFNDATPVVWLRKLKPNIHVKGADRTLSQILERRVVEEGGGRIVMAPLTKDHSTTALIKKVRGSN